MLHFFLSTKNLNLYSVKIIGKRKINDFEKSPDDNLEQAEEGF